MTRDYKAPIEQEDEDQEKEDKEYYEGLVDNTVVKTPKQVRDEFFKNRDEKFREFLEYEQERLRREGYHVPVSVLGESVHPDTVRSYEKYGLDEPDSIYLAVRRPAEQMKHNIADNKGKPPKVNTVIKRVFRLYNKNINREYLVYSKEDQFLDLTGNLHRIDYINCNTHPIATSGEVSRDYNTGKITEVKSVEKRTVFLRMVYHPIALARLTDIIAHD